MELVPPYFAYGGVRFNFSKVRNPMKTLFSQPKILLLFPLLALCLVRADAQALESIKSQEELNKAVTSLDAALFDSYNRCDLQKFASFFADDVEFYHDQGGVTLGKEKLTESVKNNICGKVTRELVPGSLQVHHMKGYGAVEMGVSRLSWKWRERSAVKITERTREKTTEALHRRREGRHPEAAFVGGSGRLGLV
jgi:hypothetical protein